MKPMTMRECMTAFIKGEPHDRIPFAEYSTILPVQECWELLGRENMGVIEWSRPYRLETPHCRFTIESYAQDGLRVEHKTLHTPKGSLTSTMKFEPVYGSGSPKEHFVKELADYDILDAYLQDVIVRYHPDQYHEQTTRLGEDGISLLACMRTPWQQLWVEWVDIANLSWHMAEDEERVLRTVELMNGIIRQVFDCACRLQPLFAQFPDNITAPMISPSYFERFCTPLYRELADRLGEEHILVGCHMDGDLKPLWSRIRESGLKIIDSFSPQPDNDTSVADAVREWPDMRLMLNFPSSVHLHTPEEIRQKTREILAQGGNTGRLQIQLSENVPSFAWRTSLPIIVEELRDWGTPAIYR